jgi:hypothetical protein
MLERWRRISYQRHHNAGLARHAESVRVKQHPPNAGFQLKYRGTSSAAPSTAIAEVAQEGEGKI